MYEEFIGYDGEPLSSKLESLIDAYETDREINLTAPFDDNSFYEIVEDVSNAILSSSMNLDSEPSSKEYTKFRNDYGEYLNLDIPKIEEKIKEIYNKHSKRNYSDISEAIKDIKKCSELSQPLRDTIPEKFKSKDDSNPPEFPLDLIHESLSIIFSKEIVNKINQAVNRAIELHRLSTSLDLDSSTKQFLARLSNCYIWEFDPECVMLCRSVIDTAYREKIPDSLCEKYYPRREVWDDFGLAKRIKVAQKEKFIDDYISTISFKIKDIGNTAIHHQPNITNDVIETIKDTMIILRQLYKEE